MLQRVGVRLADEPTCRIGFDSAVPAAVIPQVVVTKVVQARTKPEVDGRKSAAESLAKIARELGEKTKEAAALRGALKAATCKFS
eukprot:6192806-Pleurochrysis_carterae.AAC.4